jgi:hypothetical protein
MARTLAPDLAAALPALVLWLRVTQARLEVIERRLAETTAEGYVPPWLEKNPAGL